MLSNVATPGKANAMLSASSNIAFCRYVHQVTACVLYQSKKDAYNSYCDNTENPLPEIEWLKESCKHPMFKFWSITLKMELILLQFVKAIRSANFSMYIDALQLIAPWMFSLNHYNYARWLPVHIDSMVTLQDIHPDVYEQFKEGSFTAQKSNRKFSHIGLDHNHEQLNAEIKGVGGAIGLTENDASLAKWLIAGPEVSRMVEEFENRDRLHEFDSILEHHDSNPSAQKHFVADVKKMYNALDELGNPFLDDSADLYALDTKLVPGEEAIKHLNAVEALGQEQFKSYMDTRVLNNDSPISDAIVRNKMQIFKCPKARKTSKKDTQLKAARSDAALFSRLFIACQNRNGDLEQFFSHENQGAPPSLSENGNLRPAKNKSGSHFGTFCNDTVTTHTLLNTFKIIGFNFYSSFPFL